MDNMSHRAARVDDSAASLIGPADPPPFERVNPRGRAAALLICDHAGRAVPKVLERLGLADAVLRQHVAWDVGAGEVTRRLARALDAPAVLGVYSRLVIDLNRRPGTPDSISDLSHGVAVPGNRGLGRVEVEARLDQIFRPYHRAVDDAIAEARARGVDPAFVSIHSYTPVLRDIERPWHIGVSWDRDRRLSDPLIAALKADPALCIGENQPYSGLGGNGYSVEAHAVATGLADTVVEIRQDLIETPAGAEHWASVLARALAEVLSVDKAETG
ncbi:MAG: N-formylglutamate amidohydrolase [Kiloniellales bacterium]